MTAKVTSLKEMGSQHSSLEIFSQVPIGGTVVRTLKPGSIHFPKAFHRGIVGDTFALKVSEKQVVCLDSSNVCKCVNIEDFLSSRFHIINAAKTKYHNEVMATKGTNFELSKRRAEEATAKNIRMSSDESFVLHCHYKLPFGNRRSLNPFLMKQKEGSWSYFYFPPTSREE